MIDDLWGVISKIVFIRFQFEIPIEELRDLQKTGRLVFALTSGGIIEWLILSSWCRTQKLGPILAGNRKTLLLFSKPIGFLKVLLGKAHYIEYFLSNDKGPRIIFCPTNERKQLFKATPVEDLLAELYSAIVSDENSQFYFVPVFVLWRKHVRGERRKLHELLFGLSSNPNWIGKLWYLLRKREDSNIKSLGFIPLVDKEGLRMGEGVDSIDESESLKNARVIRRKIIVLIQQEMRVVLGPRYLPSTAVKETLMRDEEVQKMIQWVAKRDGVDTKKVMMLAYQYLTEIVANYTYRFIEITEIFLSWLFNRVFEGLVVNRDDINRVREVMKTKPIVFISCHRSHLDYLVVPYVLFTEGMVTPHIAAGINLSFWPAGYFLRKVGAFFIRRSFRGNVLYALVLKKYVEFLLKNRHNIKFFIEGTRSRSGKMLPPAYGLLKMILEGYQNRSLDDIALIPVSICYDEVFEEGSYSKELQGVAKEKESATGLIKSRKITKGNFGKVYVRFAEPLSIKEIIQNSDKQKSDAKLTLQKTAFQLCKKINDVSSITPKSIVSSILLAHRDPSLSLSEILRIADRMADYVTYSGMILSAPQKSSFRAAVETTIRTLQKKNFVNVIEGTPRAYAVDQKRRLVLNFYKNNAIHCFILPSICVLAFFDVVQKRKSNPKSEISFYSDFIQSALRLRNILKFEFFFSPRILFSQDLIQTLNYFSKECSWENATDEQWIQGFHQFFKDWDEATVYGCLVGELLESYSNLMKYMKDNPGEEVDKKQMTAKLVKFCTDLSQKGEISFPESISIQNFSNGVLSFENKHYLTINKIEDKSLLKVAPWNFETEQMLQDILRYLSLLNSRPAVLVAH